MPARFISTNFWTDKKVLEAFTPEDRSFYIYLLTCPATNMAGCYELSIAEASFQTGYTRETVFNLLVRMDDYHKVIKYDQQTGEVLLLHWSKYNWNKSPKTKAAVLKFAQDIKNQDYKSYVLSKVSEFFTDKKEEKKEEHEQQKETEADAHIADRISRASTSKPIKITDKRAV